MNPFGAPSEEVLDARDDARFSATLGIASVTLCLLAQCTWTLSLWVAAPLGVIALRVGSRAQKAARDDELTRHLCRIGMATGTASVIFSVLVLAIVVLYVGLYALAIFFAVLSAALGA